MLVFLFVAFLLPLLVGFDVGFSMILAAFLGIQAKTDRIVDLGDDAAVDDRRRR